MSGKTVVTETRPSEDKRKEIFLALVEAQDGHMTVTESRRVISKRFGITLDELRRVERDGLDNEWPPL